METWANEKWPDYGSTLKEKPQGSAEGLDMGYERRVQDDSTIFNPSKGKNEGAIY